MCLLDKNNFEHLLRVFNCVMMKNVSWFILIVSICLFVACKEQPKVDPTLAPRTTLQEALDAQARGDMDAYFSYMNFGSDDIDTVQQALLKAALAQKQQELQEQRQGLQASIVSTARMRSDTVAIVFYNQYYNNGDSVTCSQKMVRHDGVWKLQMRH